MKIYRLRSDTENYQFLELVDAGNWRILNKILNGELPISEWRPFPVRVCRDPKSTRPDALPSDFPNLGGLDVFSGKATKLLGATLLSNGRLLPLSSEEGEYFGFHTTTVLDALDERNSEIWRLSTGTIADIERHVFRPDALGRAPIFRLPQKKFGPTYVDETFVSRISSLGLAGFKFELVWAQQDVAKTSG